MKKYSSIYFKRSRIMHNIFYLPQARKDLKAIKDFIGKDNAGMSIRVIESILFFINNLSLFPLIGKEVELKLWLREIIQPTYKYRIIYEFDGKDIRIYAVFKYKNIDL